MVHLLKFLLRKFRFTNIIANEQYQSYNVSKNLLQNLKLGVCVIYKVTDEVIN